MAARMQYLKLHALVHTVRQLERRCQGGKI